MVKGIHWIFMIHCMNGIQWTNVNSCYAIWVAVPTPFYTSTTVLCIDILNLVHSNELSNVSLYIFSCVSNVLTNVSFKWLSGVSAPNQALRKISKTMNIRIGRIVRYMNNKKRHNKCTNPLKILWSVYLRTRELWISLVRT